MTNHVSRSLLLIWRSSVKQNSSRTRWTPQWLIKPSSISSLLVKAMALLKTETCQQIEASSTVLTINWVAYNSSQQTWMKTCKTTTEKHSRELKTLKVKPMQRWYLMNFSTHHHLNAEVGLRVLRTLQLKSLKKLPRHQRWVKELNELAVDWQTNRHHRSIWESE